MVIVMSYKVFISVEACFSNVKIRRRVTKKVQLL